MRLSKLNTARLESRPRKITRFRRRPWARRAPITLTTEHPHGLEFGVAHNDIPGEYPEPPKSKVVAGVRRGIGLASDAVVLTLASPFFAVWFLYRSTRNLLRRTRH